MYRRNVLLQEVGAIEKMGRIKNLCMDKTGTLTDNQLVAERMYEAPGVNEKYAAASAAAYIKGSGDSSQTIFAVKKICPDEYAGTILGSLGFSSTRQFGAIHIKDDDGERVILVGAPDIFLPYLKSPEEKEWVQQHIDTEAKIGKRLLFFAQSVSKEIPSKISETTLSALSLFILTNNLREGVKESVQFFQDRGVAIRIISGDNPGTVRSVAAAAGVNNTDAVITGAELETWTTSDFLEKTRHYTIFARIKPEQKEKIIEALKKDGFTAMVGDGANDALAIKKADVGIAMFDGAQATRSVASVVLVKNSFSDLPNGVGLADSIIQNIKMCASIFFGQVFVGLFFFVAVTVGGYSFPLTPLNFTFINYFTVGLPGFLLFYWVVRPAHAKIPKDDTSFLKQVLPFACVSAIPQAAVATFAFYGSLEHVQSHGPTSLVLLTLIILGFVFFLFTPLMYSGPATPNQKKQFLGLAIIEIISVVALIHIPFIAAFYNLKIPSLLSVAELVPLLTFYAVIQYGIVRWFVSITRSPSVDFIDNKV
jgi:cation-transporting ATPase E